MQFKEQGRDASTGNDQVVTDSARTFNSIAILTTLAVKLYDTAITLCTLGCVDILSVCRTAILAVEISVTV